MIRNAVNTVEGTNPAPQPPRATAASVLMSGLVVGILVLMAVKQATDTAAPSVGDEIGYFAWQQSWLSDHDLDPTDDLAAWPGAQFAMTIQRDGRTVTINKYPTGWSQAILPFTATAQLILRIDQQFRGTTHRLDGTDSLIVRAAWIGSGVWMIVGVLAMFAAARHITAPLPAAIGVVSCWLGTAAFAYTWKLPIYAHAVASAMLGIAMWIAVVELPRGTSSSRRAVFAIVLGLMIGLLASTRPPDLVLLLPIALAMLPSLIKRPLAMVWIIVGAAPSVAVELLTRKHLYGSYLFDGYRFAGESFAFSPPNLFKVLFAFHTNPAFGRGIVAVHPIVVVAIIGLIMLLRGNRRALAAGALIAIVTTTVLYGSWWAWHLNYSYGARWSADLLPLWAIGVAALVDHISPRLRGFCVALVIVLACWSVIVCLGAMQV
jgi:hypothetical protein